MALWYIHSLISDPFLTDTLSGSALDTLFHLSLFVMCSDLIAAECSFAVLTWLRKKLLDIQSKTESSMGERGGWAQKHGSLWSLRCLKHFKIALPTSGGLCFHIPPPRVQRATDPSHWYVADWFISLPETVFRWIRLIRWKKCISPPVVWLCCDDVCCLWSSWI